MNILDILDFKFSAFLASSDSKTACTCFAKISSLEWPKAVKSISPSGR